jgi:hypothetical protein
MTRVSLALCCQGMSAQNVGPPVDPFFGHLARFFNPQPSQ